MRQHAHTRQKLAVTPLVILLLAILLPHSITRCLASHTHMRGSRVHAHLNCYQGHSWRSKVSRILPGFCRTNHKHSAGLRSLPSVSGVHSRLTSRHAETDLNGLVLRGRVIDEAGRPLSNMSVNVSYLVMQQTSATSIGGYGLDPQTAMTDADGRFEVSGRPPQCTVELMVSDATGERKCSAHVPCDLTASDPRIVELKPLVLVATANVTGMVLVDGEPLANAQVTLNLSTLGGMWGRTYGTTRTDEKGRYEIRNIEAGRRLYAAYQIDNPRYSIIGGNNCRPIRSLSPGQTLELNPFEFATRTQIVSGVVVDPAGKPLSDVAVETMSPNVGTIPSRDRHRALTDTAYPSVRTGPDGRFDFESLYDRPVQLRAIVKSLSADQNERKFIRTYVTIDAGEANAKIILDPYHNSPDGVQLQPGVKPSTPAESPNQLDEPGTSGTTGTSKDVSAPWLANPDRQITGQVLFGDTEKAVVNAQVDVSMDPFQEFSNSTRTDTAGRFEVQVPPNYLLGSDSFNLSVAPENALGYHTTRTTVKFLQDQQRVDVTIRLSNGEPIRGSVVDDATGAGISGVGVTYVLEGERELTSTYWTKGRQSVTDEKGRFELFAPPNRVTLRIYQPPSGHHATHDVPNDFRWENNQSIQDGHSTQVTFEAGKAPADIRMLVSRGLILRGRAMDLSGDPIPRAVVEVKCAIFHENSGMIRFDAQSEPYRVVAGEDGRFELSGLPPNCEALVRIHDSDNKRTFASVVAADHSAAGQRVVQLESVILRPTACLQGQLLCEDEPIAGVRIVARARLSGKAFSVRDEGYATTDDDGHFRFDRLVSNVPLMLSYWTREYGRVSERGIEHLSIQVEPLQPGEQRQLPADSLTLKECFVEGMVVDTEGHPLADVEVQTAPPNEGIPAVVYREPVNDFFPNRRRRLDVQSLPPMIRTGPDGKFRFEHLLDGPIELIAHVLPSAGRQVIYGGMTRVKANANDVNVRLEIDFGPPKQIDK